MSQVLDIMMVLGQYFRGLTTIGIFYHSITFFFGIIYIIMKRVFKDELFNYVAEKGFVLSLKHPALENHNIERQLTSYIRQVRESNVSLTRKIYIRMNNRSDHDHREDIGKHTYSEHFMRHRIFETINLNHSTNKFNRNDDDDSKSKIKFIQDLTEQLKHLSRLDADKTNIWPANRTTPVSNEIKQY